MSIDAPADSEIVDFAVAPDGRALAFTAIAPERGSMLWVRRLDVQEPREIHGTDGASMPFWSPDGQSIGFFAEGRIKTVRVNGDVPISVAPAPRPRGASWNADNVILFASDAGLARVPAYGGTAQRVGHSSAAPMSPRWPQFLPDGKRFLFSASGPQGASGIYVGNLDSGETRLLVDGSAGGFYSGGRLLHLRDGILMSQAFDAARLALSGDPVAVADSIHARGNGAAPISAGRSMLAYRAGRASDVHRLMWIDRSGRPFDAGNEPIEIGQGDFAISPDLRRAAVSRRATGAGSDLWMHDLMRGGSMRMTFDGRGVTTPLWSPDGGQVAFVSGAPGTETDIRTIDVNASRQPESLHKWPHETALESWSPDRRALVFTATVGTKLETWILPLEGDRKPSPILKGEFNFSQAQVSPDGRWLAYVSDQSGSDEVYVRAFPPASEPFAQVSINGGRQPRWSRSGRELYYLSPNQHVMVAPLEAGTFSRLGTPQMLFRLPYGVDRFDVADGARFLISMPVQEQRRAPIHVVLNWSAGR